MLTKEILVRSLKKLGIKRGDNVFISSNIIAIGSIDNVENKQEYCEVFLSAFKEVIGNNGTIIVPSYTNQTAREGKNFVLEETPSKMGLFAEYLRKKKKSVRSIHPVNSVVAYGKKSSFICKKNSSSDFGWGSPFSRMEEIGCKMISVGLTSAYSLSILHYIEAMYCVPYRYNKLLNIKTFANGKEDKRPFLINARYLDINLSYDYSKWVALLHNKKKIKGMKVGKGFIFIVSFKEAISSVKSEMNKNPYFFLDKKPNFIKDKIPFDGVTKDRERNIKKYSNNKLRRYSKYSSFYKGHKIRDAKEAELDLKIVNRMKS